MDEIEEEKKMVEIFLKIIGPSPPCRLKVPSSIKVHELRKMIAGNRQMAIENLRLVLRGNVLHDTENGDDEVVQLKNGDSLIVAVKPKPPPKHFRDEFEDDDDDELRFQLPPSTSKWKRKLFYMLRDKLKFPGEARIVVFTSFIVNVKLSSCSSSPVPLPFHLFVDMLLMVIFSISPKVWIIIMTWFILASIARRYEVAPLFLLATGFGLIFYNLGHRKQGELSAYSVFNEDFRELPGTLNADHIDRDIRAGRF